MSAVRPSEMVSSLVAQLSRARRRVVWLVGVLAITLVAYGSPFAGRAEAAPTPEPTPNPAPSSLTQAGLEPTGAGVVRPDYVSAEVTAHSSGQRVEVLSARSDYSRTWALPKGGFESESTGSPVRFADPGDPTVWHDVDTSLVVKADGSISPKSVPQSLVLGGAGDPADELIHTANQGTTAAVIPSLTFGSGANRTLPTPRLDGATATYSDILPGVDVQIEARASGFEQLWVAKDRTGLDALLSEQVSGDQGVNATLTTSKLSAVPQTDGGVEFTDASKKTVAELAPPMMWDAVMAPDGMPANEVAGDIDVVKAGNLLSDKQAASGDLELSVVPNQAWLEDPARKFPITIDPTYVTGTDQAPIFDTYVKESATTDRSTSTYLPVGYGSDALKNRSFLNFSTTPFQGKKIMSATLSLWGDDGGSCTPSGWSAYGSTLATTSSRWTAQPTIGTKYATSTDTKGFNSSCAAGWSNIEMRTQAQAWADGSATTAGVALKADDETTVTKYHRFWSSDASSNVPVLRWSYDRPPAQMMTPSLSQAVSYKPSGSSSSYLYLPTTAPSVSGIVPSDPDGDVVRGRFAAFTDSTTATMNSSCVSTTFVASGSSSSCSLGSGLSANNSYWLRGRAEDSNGQIGAYSDPTEIRIASTTPTAPVITCPGYANNSWTTTAPNAALSCTISAVGSGYSAPSAVKWSVDGYAPTSHAIPQSTSASTAQWTVSVPQWTGGHSIEAWAINPAGLTSAKSTWEAGWSSAAFSQPRRADRPVTTDRIRLIGAAQPPNSGSPLPAARVQWRVSGYNVSNVGYTDAPAGTAFALALGGGGVKFNGDFDTNSLVGLTDPQSKTVGDRTPTMLDLRVCLTYDSGSTCTGHVVVQHVPHAFGGSFPQAVAGPGQVALWTGELSVENSDASLTTPDGALSVSRSHTSFAGPAAPQNAVFGPGWTASFDGSGSGVGGSELRDGTAFDGTIVLADSIGSLLTYQTPGTTPGLRRTTPDLPQGIYPAADDDTAESDVTLTVSGTGTSTVAELKSDSGTVTRFAVTAAPVAGAAATFRAVEVRETATSTRTTYIYDGSGRVSAIIAPLPDGVTSCVPGTPTNGCRVLKIVYAGATTATSTTPGDYSGQVKQITAQVNSDADKVLAAYAYDTAGRLLTETDSRTGLATNYSWTGTGTGLRLTTFTPPGEAPYTFNYSNNKLFSVTRPNPASAGGGTAQLGAYIYNVPLSGTVSALPNMTTEPARWNQDRMPTWAAAVFGQDKPISTAPAAGSADWQYADLQFTDAQGYTLNTASYGAGDWQLTAADYDDQGNVVHTWDARAIGAIRDGSAAGGAAALQFATTTLYNADVVSSGSVVTPAGMLITETYGPAHTVVSSDGSLQLLRTHSSTTYDQGAPNSGINTETDQPYRLPTKTVTTAETVDGAKNATLNITLTGYDSIATGDTSGWALGQATSVTNDIDQSGTVTSGDLVSKTRYDARGRLIEHRQPKSNGADAGTRLTSYYTGSTTGASGCTSKPEWSGMVCQAGPAAQPSGQTIPTTKTTGYTWDLQPTTSVDTSGSATSTTTISYSSQDRPTTAGVVVSGLAGSAAQPAMTTAYDSATGKAIGTTSTAGSTGISYDNWGRQVTQTNTPAGQSADTGTTTYDVNGRVTSVVDSNGQTTYVYDGTDADSKAERRGLITAVKVKAASGTEYTATGAYDDAGDLSLEKLPGNLIRRSTVDIAGRQIGLTVNGQAVNPDTGNLDADQPWLGWTTTSNAQSQIIREYTPDGTALNNAGQSDRLFTYDRAGRLTKVQDATGTPNASGVVPCTTRTYTFDDNGNRTGQNTISANTNGTCNGTGGSPLTRAYDTADRATTGAGASGTYSYDQFGRQTIIPAVDTPNPGRGNLSLAYYDDDTIRTVSQGTLGSGGTKTSHTLDGMNRRLVQTTQTDAGTSTITRHYTDLSDNPTWTTQVSGGSTTTTRYSHLLDGDLGLTLTSVGSNMTAQLDLNTPRGDTAATVTLGSAMTAPGGSSAVGIESWTTYTEFGTSQQATSALPGGTTGIGYGWLGAQERATNSADGLTNMGARLYNPVTGSFSTPDPIYGGNSTPYVYPQDPVNGSDTSGLKENEHPEPNWNQIWNAGLNTFWGENAEQIARRFWKNHVFNWMSAALIPVYHAKGKAGKYKDLEYTIYVVTYTTYKCKCGTEHVWKFGITAQRDWYNRARIGVNDCKSAGRTNCRARQVAYATGWYNARYVEAALIDYWAYRNWGFCPPGHKKRFKCA